MSIMATRSLDIASNHVTVTKRQNAAWPSTTVANKKNSSPSLYLIVVGKLPFRSSRFQADMFLTHEQFLTLLLLIIMTSTIIFARGHLVRRRVRMEIQAAVDRGEITQARGNQISSRLATMTFGLGRWSNSWVRMVADDYEAAENRRTTRRRKKAKDYGEPPKLFDIDLSGGIDEKSASFSLINQVSTTQTCRKNGIRNLSLIVNSHSHYITLLRITSFRRKLLACSKHYQLGQTQQALLPPQTISVKRLNDLSVISECDLGQPLFSATPLHDLPL